MNFLRDNKREFIVLITYILFVPFQLGMIPLLILSEISNTNLVDSDFINLAVGICVSAILALVLFRKEIIDSFAYFKEHTLLRVLSLPMWMALILLVEAIAGHIYGAGLSSENEAFISESSNHIPLFITIIVLGILGPLIEEIIFRHIFLNRLSIYTGTVIAVLISTGLFTVMHMQQPMDFILYAPGALILAIAYLTSHRSLAFIISLHMLNNILGLLA